MKREPGERSDEWVETVVPSQARIVGLAAALAPPAKQAIRPAGAEAAPDPDPDPAALLAQERERVLAQARRDGRAEGLADAAAELQAQRERVRAQIEADNAERAQALDEQRAELSALARTVAQRLAEAETELREVVVEIAYAALCRALGEREAAARGQTTAALCAQLLDEYRHRPATLRIGPEAFDAVNAAVAAQTELRVLIDPTLRPGECRLQTRKGAYDTRLEDRLDALKQALLRGLEAEPR
ncbi:flagellar assembly protein FliH [Lysobacter enzymogenes]|uniref:FliH/SctL family protein n=1 Tax=Lysobacter enzymogenes TaxID=69 RepID=UPI003398D5E0